MAHFRRFLLLAFALASCMGSSLAQHVDHERGLIADEYDARTTVLPTAYASKSGAASAVFEVDYQGFSPEAQQALEYALSIWATHLSSAVPIRIQARWETLETNTLGSAGPTFIVGFQGSPHSSTWYPPALASAITGQNVLSAGQYDITASFNSSRSDWYFGTDAATPIGTFDFVSVVMHEIGHGLGMIGTFKVEGEGASGANSCSGASDGEACWGFTPQGQTQPWPFVTDRFVYDASQIALIDILEYPIPSVALADALTSNGLHFQGPITRSTYGDVAPRLYAPASYAPSSTVAHLDEDDFPPGDPNSLMTPRLARAEAIHSPGPVFCGILADIGWPLGGSCDFLIQNPGTGYDGGDGGDGDGGDDGSTDDGTGDGSGDDGSIDDGTGDGSGDDGSTDDGTTDGSGDDGSTDDGTTDGSGDDGSTDDGTTDGSGDDGSTDDGTGDGSGDDGSTDDGTGDGSGDDGSTDDGTGDGSGDDGSTDETDGEEDGSESGEDGSPVSADLPTLPYALTVDGPYPNPTASTATLHVSSGVSQRVEISILDMTGRRVAAIDDLHLVAGSPRVVALSGLSLAPGVYIVRITGAHASIHKTLVVVR
jgi:hypothetical protein